MRIHSPNSWSRNTVTANARWIMFKIKYMILPAGSQVGCHLDSGSSGCHAGQLLPLLVWKCIPPESTSRSQGFTAALIYSILMKTVWWNVELDKIIAPSPLSTSLRALSNVVFEILALLAGPHTRYLPCRSYGSAVEWADRGSRLRSDKDEQTRSTAHAQFCLVLEREQLWDGMVTPVKNTSFWPKVSRERQVFRIQGLIKSYTYTEKDPMCICKN